jgi:chromatin-remodeling ATPase INO80
MLRRVKKDVITEMTGKTEITVHCKLSSRQQAFYQAIKNKISLAELFDGTRGHLNEKKMINLMNIVMQLRKVQILILCVLFFLSCIFCLLHFDKRELTIEFI